MANQVTITQGSAHGWAVYHNGNLVAGATNFQDALNHVADAFDHPRASLPKVILLSADEAARIAQIRGLINLANRIAAIRMVRELSGAGLKEAKDAVDALL